jgi:hypothetical protein
MDKKRSSFMKKLFIATALMALCLTANAETNTASSGTGLKVSTIVPSTGLRVYTEARTGATVIVLVEPDRARVYTEAAQTTANTTVGTNGSAKKE